MNRVVGFVFALGVTVGVGFGGAQSKPNFSGDWKMNLVKSDFGAAPAPDSMCSTLIPAAPGAAAATRVSVRASPGSFPAPAGT